MGPERFYYALYDHPAELRRLLERLTELYIHWVRSQLEILPRVSGGYCNQYGIWSPGTCVRTQEDYALNLSPRLFREFIMPCTRQVADSFQYHVFHTHSAFPALAEWALEIDNLRALEVVLDPKGPSLEELIPMWNGILEKKSLVIVGPMTERQLDLLVSRLSPGGLWLDAELVPEGQDIQTTWAWSKTAMGTD
jgi:hypothetical protein